MRRKPKDPKGDIAKAQQHLIDKIAEIEQDPESSPVPLKPEDNVATSLHKKLGGKFTAMPITEKRLAVFLEVLAETGSEFAAARAATPWSTVKTGGMGAFNKYMRKHPEFKEAFEQAKAFALGRVEAEIMRRTFTPQKRPVVSHGEIIAHEEKYDNRLLLRVAEKLNPEWSQKKEVKHTGKVDAGVLVVPGTAVTEETWENQFSGQQYPALDVSEAEVVKDPEDEKK